MLHQHEIKLINLVYLPDGNKQLCIQITESTNQFLVISKGEQPK